MTFPPSFLSISSLPLPFLPLPSPPCPGGGGQTATQIQTESPRKRRIKAYAKAHAKAHGLEPSFDWPPPPLPTSFHLDSSSSPIPSDTSSTEADPVCQRTSPQKGIEWGVTAAASRRKTWMRMRSSPGLAGSNMLSKSTDPTHTCLILDGPDFFFSRSNVFPQAKNVKQKLTSLVLVYARTHKHTQCIYTCAFALALFHCVNCYPIAVKSLELILMLFMPCVCMHL
jgi:hypothetical protein